MREKFLRFTYAAATRPVIFFAVFAAMFAACAGAVSVAAELYRLTHEDAFPADADAEDM